MEKTKQNPLKIITNAGYSKKVARLLNQQSNFGTMEHPDITVQHKSDCGDVLILYMKLDKQKIVDAKYEYIGCRGLEAAAASLTEMIKEKTLQEADKINFLDVLTYLEEIPPSKYECIHLALNTLKKGIRNFNNKILSKSDF
jgi:NifU-like protein involved in Fe-S cluster formation